MNQYQYFEFLAIDRPLSAREMDKLRAISTRAKITPVSLVNDYRWGSLKAEPRDLLKKFFDLHLFIDDWGEAVFMVRLPKDAVDQKTLKAFCIGPSLGVKKYSECWLLTWLLDASEDSNRFADIKEESASWMTRLAPLREELLRGDLRGLYIGWLKDVDSEDAEPDALEPMASSGLGPLTAAQKALAKFLDVNVDLLAGMVSDSKKNPPEAAVDQVTLNAWLDDLPKTEVREYLRQMLDGQSANAERALKQRHAAWQAQRATPSEGERRSVAELRQLAEHAKSLRLIKEAKASRQAEARKAKADRQAEAERMKQRDARLAKLSENFSQAWKTAHEGASTGHAKGYDAACSQLVDLRDACCKHATLEVFRAEFQKFLAEHLRRRALVQRLVQAGLCKEFFENGEERVQAS